MLFSRNVSEKRRSLSPVHFLRFLVGIVKNNPSICVGIFRVWGNISFVKIDFLFGWYSNQRPYKKEIETSILVCKYFLNEELIYVYLNFCGHNVKDDSTRVNLRMKYSKSWILKNVLENANSLRFCHDLVFLFVTLKLSLLFVYLTICHKLNFNLSESSFHF